MKTKISNNNMSNVMVKISIFNTFNLNFLKILDRIFLSTDLDLASQNLTNKYISKIIYFILSTKTFLQTRIIFPFLFDRFKLSLKHDNIQNLNS